MSGESPHYVRPSDRARPGDPAVFGRRVESARQILRRLGYTALAAATALAGSDQCMHMGRVRDEWDETTCLDCDLRFASIEDLARAGGWNPITRAWEASS